MMHPRKGRRKQPNLHNVRIKNIKLKARLDLDEFLGWLHIIENEIVKGIKIMFVALKL